MSDKKEDKINGVPKEFCYGDNKPFVSNVKELKEQLERLPDDLPIRSDFNDCGAYMFVYNVNSSAFLEFEEETW